MIYPSVLEFIAPIHSPDVRWLQMS